MDQATPSMIFPDGIVSPIQKDENGFFLEYEGKVFTQTPPLLKFVASDGTSINIRVPMDLSGEVYIGEYSRAGETVLCNLLHTPADTSNCYIFFLLVAMAIIIVERTFYA